MLHQTSQLRANHERFVRRVVDGETVWGLDQGDGLASCTSHDHADRSVIMFWSDRAYASRALAEMPDCTPQSMTLFEFLFRWLPGMEGDGVMAGCNWTTDLAGIESEAEDLQSQILDAMPEEMIQRYHTQLREQLGF